MKFLHYIGIYLLGVSAIVIALSLWQIKYGSGHADFSFLLLLPFAIGLLWARRWAVWGTGLLGVGTVTLAVATAIIYSASATSGPTIEFGPLTMTEPNAIHLWGLALAYVFVFGIPMMSVLAKRLELRS